jgi:hypothetical protein
MAEEVKKASMGLFYMGTIPFMRALPKQSLKPSYWELRFQHMNFGKTLKFSL